MFYLNYALLIAGRGLAEDGSFFQALGTDV